jgi:hypothetical protein
VTPREFLLIVGALGITWAIVIAAVIWTIRAVSV